MRNILIAQRLLRENRDLCLRYKLSLTIDYIINLRKIKKTHGLSLFSVLTGHRVSNNTLPRNKEMIEDIRSEAKKEKFVHSSNVDLNAELQEMKRKDYEIRINKIKEITRKLTKVINIKYLMDLRNSQLNAQKLLEILSRHIETYKKSIQELVEGQREVTLNKDFKFDDGETVKEKMDKFEFKAREHLTSNEMFNKIKNNK